MKNPLVITIIVALIVGAGAFFGGMKYQQSKQTTTGIGQNGGRFQGNGGARNGSRPTAGQIISTDATSMTIKLQDGSSKIVLFNDKTTINKAAAGTKDDLQTGTTVAVFGTSNSDGSVTAANVQINPQQGMYRQGASPSPTTK